MRVSSRARTRLSWATSMLLVPALCAAGEAPQSPIVDGREYLVPSLSANPFHVEGGERPFLNRVSFSPAFGSLGSERLYALRFAYNPNSWLGWEASVGHNPGQSVHALLHTLDAVARYPLPWRAQPYVRVGYGMILVYPGESLNADPATANLFAAGGGVELYVRNDLAIRADARSLTAVGGDTHQGGGVAHRYEEFTIGLSFYRGLSK